MQFDDFMKGLQKAAAEGDVDVRIVDGHPGRSRDGSTFDDSIQARCAIDTYQAWTRYTLDDFRPGTLVKQGKWLSGPKDWGVGVVVEVLPGHRINTEEAGNWTYNCLAEVRVLWRDPSGNWAAHWAQAGGLEIYTGEVAS
jgi:hypothetical protein